jgi:hypothetical protein
MLPAGQRLSPAAGLLRSASLVTGWLTQVDNREPPKEGHVDLVELDGNLPWPGRSKRRR